MSRPRKGPPLEGKLLALRETWLSNLEAELAKRDEAERVHHAQLLADIERRKAERDVGDLV